MKIQVTGLAETLREVNKVDPLLRRQLNKDIRSIVKPLLTEITQAIPTLAPLSGMIHNGRTGWPNRKNPLIKIDARKPRKNLNQPKQSVLMNVVRITTKGAPVAIVDMAGKSGGTKSRREAKYQRPKFANSLPGDPSRYMWAKAESALPMLEREMNVTIKKVIFRANQQLMKVR